MNCGTANGAGVEVMVSRESEFRDTVVSGGRYESIAGEMRNLVRQSIGNL